MVAAHSAESIEEGAEDSLVEGLVKFYEELVSELGVFLVHFIKVFIDNRNLPAIKIAKIELVEIVLEVSVVLGRFGRVSQGELVRIC